MKTGISCAPCWAGTWWTTTSARAGGIYALMSFTVTERWREIGIRTALGAHPGRILRSVFARAVRQLAVGVEWAWGSRRCWSWQAGAR